MTRDVEAQRQRRLLDGLLAAKADVSTLPTREAGARALRGLQAYRANADAWSLEPLANDEGGGFTLWRITRR